MLEPNRKHLEAFVDAIFRRATRGYVSVRSFREGDISEKFRFMSAPVADRAFLLDVVEDEARRAAQAPFPVVFCPPLCTLSSKDSAKESDIAEGLAITAELDQHPQQARERLIAILGAPTVEVKSGGRWKNGDKVEDKLHLHWRLARPATGADELGKLKRARSLVSRLVDGDTSCDPVCHPVRWPGSWHRKKEPRPCKIIVQNSNVEIEIELETALAALIKAATAAGISETTRGGGVAPIGNVGGAEDWARIFGAVIKGADLHVSTRDLAAKLITIGIDDGAAVNLIRGILQNSTAPRDDRYRARYSKIPELVRTAEIKFRETPREKVQRVLNAVARDVSLFSKGERAIRKLVAERVIDNAAAENALKALSIIVQKIATESVVS